MLFYFIFYKHTRENHILNALYYMQNIVLEFKRANISDSLKLLTWISHVQCVVYVAVTSQSICSQLFLRCLQVSINEK